MFHELTIEAYQIASLTAKMPAVGATTAKGRVKIMTAQRLVYLDHSATTPVDRRVVEAMLPYLTDVYGNPSSAHSFGRKAERAVEDARETVARVLNCYPSEIVFTSGGSESDNLALRGTAWQARRAGRGTHLLTSPIEHSAVTRTAQQLTDVMDFRHAFLPVDPFGIVHPADLEAACEPDTILVSVMYANNEVGTIEPIRALAEVARSKGVLFHTDAVQAAGQLPLDVQALGVDLLSISAHKFYGPKGVGVLYCRRGLELVPSQSGGSHEGGRRAGTHNTPYIVGLARALEIAYEEFDEYVRHYTAMRDLLVDSVLQRIPSARLTGHPQQRLASHASFVFEGVDSSRLIMHLDMKGVAASGGSACKTGVPEPSSVLLAMGYSPSEAIGSLRLTVGRQTTEADIEYAVNTLVEVVEKLKRLAPVA